MKEIKKIEERNKRSVRDLFSSLKIKKKSKLKDIEKDEIKYEVINPKITRLKVVEAPTQTSIEYTAQQQTTQSQQPIEQQEEQKDDVDEIIAKIKKLVEEEDVDRT